jgi:hypothetical protein
MGTYTIFFSILSQRQTQKEEGARRNIESVTIINKRVAGLEVITFSGSGHIPQVTHPEDFSEAIKGFIHNHQV